jgi:hypothetical protein
MYKIKRLLSNLERLSGTVSVSVNGMDTADMIKTLADALLDLDSRLKVVECDTSTSRNDGGLK